MIKKCKRLIKLKQMSKGIKNLQLSYNNTPQLIAHQRAFRMDDQKGRLQDLNLWKIFSKIPKTTSLKNEDKDRPEGFPFQDQRLIVISAFKGQDTGTTESPPKQYRGYRNQMKRYISDDGFNFTNKMTSIQKIPKTNEVSTSCNPVQNSGQVENCQDPGSYQKSVEFTMYKRAIVSGNLSEMKSKYRINRQTSRKPTKGLNKPGSKLKLPELKQQKKFPVLVKDPQQLKQIKSQSYIIVEYPSERIIVGHRSTVSVQIASLTKIMTYYTVMQFVKEKGIDIKNQIIKVSEEVYNIGGTSAELAEGEEYTVEQMLYGLMLPSGNDAANELAYWMGSYLISSSDQKAKLKAFVGQMNKNAKTLELKSTKFGNPHGLPTQDGRSTAADVAKISGICMKQDLFKTIVKCKIFKITVKNGNKTRDVCWQNTNKLLRREGFIGIKTGITVTAGPCLATAYTFRDKTYICVILRASKVSGRFKETRLLLHWSLTKLHSQDLTDIQKQRLRKLKRTDQDLDSDYSQDEHQFRYNVGNAGEYRRRVNILKYQM